MHRLTMSRKTESALVFQWLCPCAKASTRRNRQNNASSAVKPVRPCSRAELLNLSRRFCDRVSSSSRMHASFLCSTEFLIEGLSVNAVRYSLQNVNTLIILLHSNRKHFCLTHNHASRASSSAISRRRFRAASWMSLSVCLVYLT